MTGAASRIAPPSSTQLNGLTLFIPPNQSRISDQPIPKRERCLGTQTHGGPHAKIKQRPTSAQHAPLPSPSPRQFSGVDGSAKPGPAAYPGGVLASRPILCPTSNVQTDDGCRLKCACTEPTSSGISRCVLRPTTPLRSASSSPASSAAATPRRPGTAARAPCPQPFQFRPGPGRRGQLDHVRRISDPATACDQPDKTRSPSLAEHDAHAVVVLVLLFCSADSGLRTGSSWAALAQR